MDFADVIQQDIDALDGLSNSNMYLRKKIVNKLETAIDSIDFTKANDMKSTQLMAVTGLVTALSGTLNDMEGSRLNVIKSKQKIAQDKNEDKAFGALVTQFLKDISVKGLNNLPIDTSQSKIDEDLEKAIESNKITVSDDEISSNSESEERISEIVDDIL